MALIKCDECGQQVSDRSLFCPHCGYPTHLNKAFRGEEPETFKKLESLLSEKEEQQPISPISPISPIDDDDARIRRNERAKLIVFIGVFAVLLAAILFAAAVAGDSCNYTIGRFFGRKLFADPNSRIFKRSHLDKTHAFYPVSYTHLTLPTT